MILAATSERGCCPTCGTPYERVVDTALVPQYACRHGGFAAKGTAKGMVDMSQTWTPGSLTTNTLGFNARCTCHGFFHTERIWILKDGQWKRKRKTYYVPTTPYLYSTIYRLRDDVPEPIIDELKQLGLLRETAP